MSSDLPILYSFRRCPYAMRARLAIASSNLPCQLREIVLRDKAPDMLAASPKGTVPVLVVPDAPDGQTVIEESLDIMLHVLAQNDPENLLADEDTNAAMLALIAENDGPFKTQLDRTKYADRLERQGEQVDVETERQGALIFLRKLDGLLAQTPYLFGEQLRLADIAIFPFIRQFAHVDEDWFEVQSLPHLTKWFHDLRASERFQSIMAKYDKWQAGDDVTLFPSI